MKRKKEESPPSRIWTLGLLPPDCEGDLEKIDEQLRLAGKYYNVLVPIEVGRRYEVDKAKSEHPDVAPWEKLVKDGKREVHALRLGLKILRSGTHQRVHLELVRVKELKVELKALRDKIAAMTKDNPQWSEVKAQIKRISEEIKVLRAKIKALRMEGKRRFKEEAESVRMKVASLKPLWKALHEAKSKIEDDPEVKAKVDAANAKANAATKAAYAAIRAEGLYWGTVLLVDKAMEQARRGKYPPKFHHRLDVGRIGVQIQGGIPASELFGEGQLIRLVPVPDGAYSNPSRSERGRLARSRVKLRVGSDEKDRPIWVDLPVIVHRQLPDDAVAKWAWIRRQQVAGRYRYELQITAEAKSFGREEPKGEATVAVDIGWRHMGHNALRVAYFVAADGRASEIRLPEDVLDRLGQSDSLRSRRDEKFNEVKEILLAFMRTTSVKPPEWFAMACRSLPFWRSQARLRRMVAAWSEQRWKGDESIFAALWEWRKKDWHLYTWEANVRDGALARRKDFFRNVAKVIADLSATVVLENFDLRDMAKLPKPEDEKEKAPQSQRSNRYVAALSEFRLALKSACELSGARIVKVPAEWTTIDCHVCNAHEKWDPAPRVNHKCVVCGTDWDQDWNAGVNLLKRFDSKLPTPSLKLRRMVDLYVAPRAVRDSVRMARYKARREQRTRDAT